jgi:branched-chain amino acid transport system ATP-binding protein
MSLLHVDDVVVQFGGVTAVNHAQFEVEAGTVTGLIGPNGAGKTTCFNVITGLQKPTSGRVLLDGHDITRMPVNRRARRGIGRTFQRLEAFGSLTVEDNVRTALDIHDGVKGLLRSVDG